jgi:type I restriction enzyme R subunit
MKSADHHRREHADQIKSTDRHSNLVWADSLGSYAYIAQLVDFGDPELENYSAFVKLLQKRLNGEPPESVDLKGLVLTGFDIKHKGDVPGDKDDETVLKPIGPGSGGGER